VNSQPADTDLHLQATCEPVWQQGGWLSVGDADLRRPSAGKFCGCSL